MKEDIHKEVCKLD